MNAHLKYFIKRRHLLLSGAVSETKPLQPQQQQPQRQVHSPPMSPSSPPPPSSQRMYLSPPPPHAVPLPRPPLLPLPGLLGMIKAVPRLCLPPPPFPPFPPRGGAPLVSPPSSPGGVSSTTIRARQQLERRDREDQLSCRECDYTTEKVRQIVEHEWRKHSVMSDLLYSCYMCEYKTAHLYLLKNHLAKHWG